MEVLLTLFMSILTIPNPGTFPLSTETEYWSCEKPVWADGPHLIDRHFVGTIVNPCRFEAQSGGGPTELEGYLNDKVVRTAIEIHAGPIAETYLELPGNYYDVTVDVGSKKPQLVRQDIKIASDQAQRLEFFTHTKKVITPGITQKYLKDTQILISIRRQPTQTNRDYRLDSATTIRLKKPWFMTMERIKREIEELVVENQKPVIEEIAGHI